jgi:hypothetical protein
LSTSTAAPSPAPLAEDDRRRFGDALAAAFDRAAARGAHAERWLAVGPWRLRIRLATPALAEPFLQALDHLGIDPPPAPHRDRAPDLTVLLWDEASSGIGLPACPWPEARFLGRGDLEHGWGPGVHAVFSTSSRMLQYLDGPARFAVCWIRDPAALMAWERAAPLRSVLAGWARTVGGFLVHGAGVGLGGDGLLLTGPGGSGKSTTALACLAAGFAFAGDDFVMLSPVPGGGGAVDLDGLYGSAKVAAGELDAEVALAGPGPPPDAAVVRDGGKVVLWLNQSHRPQMAGRLRLRAVVVPVPAGRAEPVLRRASAVDVVRALLPSSAFLSAGAERRGYAAVIELVRSMPAFVLELGRRRADNAEVLERWLHAG